jgi:hypothetical protein
MMCIKKIETLHIPIAQMKGEPVTSPVMAIRTPSKANAGDRAEAYNFTIHMAAAGQWNLKKRGILSSAVMHPATAIGI